MVGITSSKFIKRKREGLLKGDMDIIGIPEKEFGTIVCSNSIEDAIEYMKKIKMTEFSLGWIGKLLMEKEIEAKKQLSSIGIEIK